MKRPSFFFLCVLFVLFCGMLQHINASSLETILQSGQLHAAFTDKSYKSIHRDLAESFARHLNVTLIPVIIPWKEMFCIEGSFPPEVMVNPSVFYVPDVFRQCDIICNSITIIPWREKLMDFVETFKVTELLITPQNHLLKNIYDLKEKRIAFLGHTTFEQNLASINQEIGGDIIMIPTDKTSDGYDLIMNNGADGLILDSDNALLFLKKQKGFDISFPVSPARKSGWGVKKNNQELLLELNNFFSGLFGTSEINPYFVTHFGVNYETYEKIVQAHGQKKILNQQKKRDLDDILQSKKLIIGIRERPFVYQKNGKIQFNHALALAFAKELGVEAVLYEISSFSDYWKNESGRIEKDQSYTPDVFNHIDIACDVIEPLDWRKNKIDIISFFPLIQTVIARKQTEIHTVDDLKKLKGVTSKSSTYEELMTDNGITDYYYSPVSGFIEEIKSGRAQYAIVENGFFYTRDNPDLQIKLVLGKIKERGWAIQKNHPKLKHKLYEFFEKVITDGRLDSLLADQTGISLKEMKKFTRSFHWKNQVGQFSFVQYSKDNGLPQDPILSIFQDHDGLMWFGTTSGLVRYNGKQMTRIDVTDGLVGNTVLDINEDNNGIIYLGTSNGLSAICDHNVQTLIGGPEIRKILIDCNNNKWLLGDDLMVYSHQQKITNISDQHPSLKTNIHDITLSNNLSGLYLSTSKGTYYIDNQFQLKKQNDISSHAICTASDGSIWMASEDQIMVNLGEKIIQANDRLNLEKTHIKKICRLKDDSLYMLSDSKIIEIVTLNQDAIIYDHNVGMLPATLYSIFKDIENNIWIGFTGNIQKLTNFSLRFFFPEKIHTDINQFFQDDKNRIWISGSNGVYFYKDTLVDFTPRLNVSERKCHAILHKDSIIIANISGLYEFDQELNLIHHQPFHPPIYYLKNICVSPTKEIYLITERNSIHYMKNTNSEPVKIKNNLTRQAEMLICHQGQMVGGNASGLFHMRNQNVMQLARLNIHVKALYSDNENLWLGTDKGFGVFKNNTFSVIESLKKISVNAISPEKNGKRLYLGTDNGLICFNPSTQAIDFSIDQRGGLPANRVSLNGLFVDRDNILWIGTYLGISLFDISKQETLKYKPQCHIERLLINGKTISPGLQLFSPKTPMVFPWNQNNMIIDLLGISFNDEQSIGYDYYMRGLPNYNKILETNKSSRAVYQNLAPGNYDFHYRAKGKDNIWCDFQSFSFIIEKPYWQTIQFYTTMIILFIIMTWSGMIVYAKIRLRKTQQLADVLQKKVKERTTQLEQTNQKLSQLNAEKDRFFTIVSQDLRNPFSVLMSVSDLLESYFDSFDDAEKKGYIHEIYETTSLLNKMLENLERWSEIRSGRLSIEQSQFHLSDLINEHIHIIDQYANQKNISIDNRIDKNLEIYADVNQLIILVDHLLSNAIKYSTPESRVTLSAEKKGDNVELRIIDEGIGIDEQTLNKLFCIDHYHVTPGTANEKGTGLGLLICKVIVEKNGGTIQIMSEKGKGCTVIVTLPSCQVNKMNLPATSSL